MALEHPPSILRTRLLFDRALEVPAEERRRRLEAWCAGDVELLAAVLRLLEFAAASEPDGGSPASGVRHLEAGEELGGYRLLERLADAGDGALTFRACPAGPSGGRAVALKTFRSVDRAPDRRCAREAAVLRRLGGAAFPKLIEEGRVTTADGRIDFLAIEWIDGLHLDEWASAPREEQDFDRIARVFAALCDALGELHAAGIRHADLKPRNVLVCADERVVVLDFGCADGPGAGAAAGARGMPAAGTPRYMSPEQARRAARLDARSDVFALGVMLFEALSGHPAREGLQRLPLPDQLEIVANLEAPRLSSRCPAAGRDLDRIVHRATRHAPRLRYAGAGEMLRDLRLYLAGRPIPEPPTPWTLEVAAFARRHKVVTVVGASAFLLVGAASIISLHLATEARRLRAESAQRLESVLGLAAVVALDADDLLRGVPGAVETRRLLAHQAAERLEEAAGFADTPDVRRRIAETRIRLARALGAGYGPHLGDLPGAQAELHRAIDEYRALIASRDARPEDRWRLGEALVLRASHQPRFFGQLERRFEEAQQLLLGGDTAALDAQARRAAADWTLYAAMEIRKRPEDGGLPRCLELLDRGVHLLRQTPSGPAPRDVEIIARLLRHRALALREVGQPGGLPVALEGWRLASSLAADEHPPGYLHQQAAIHQVELAHHLALSGDTSAARHVREALDRIEVLVGLDPEEHTIRRSAAVTPSLAAEALRTLARADEIPIGQRIAYLREAIAAIDVGSQRLAAFAVAGGLQVWEQHYERFLLEQRDSTLQELAVLERSERDRAAQP